MRFWSRCSLSDVFREKVVLKNLVKFTGKHLYWSLSLFDKGFAKFLRTPILQNMWNGCLCGFFYMERLKDCHTLLNNLQGPKKCICFIWAIQSTKKHWNEREHWYEMNLTHFFPMLPFDLPANIGKPKVFWCFQRNSNGTLQVNILLA